MARAISLILALGLTVLCAVSLARHAPPWLLWPQALAALASFGMAAMVGTRPGLRGAPPAIALLLFAAWIVGLVTRAPASLTWWTFGFACGQALFATAIVLSPLSRATPDDEVPPTAGRR